MEQEADSVPWWVVLGILLFGLAMVGGMGVVLLESGSLLTLHP